MTYDINPDHIGGFYMEPHCVLCPNIDPELKEPFLLSPNTEVVNIIYLFR